MRPGVTDVYVHDEAGNPVLRLSDVANGSLTTWLSSVAKLLREMVGAEPRIVLAFDRGGAFPEQLVALRDEGFELVTYERKPYPLLAATAFDISFTHDGETLRRERRTDQPRRGPGTLASGLAARQRRTPGQPARRRTRCRSPSCTRSCAAAGCRRTASITRSQRWGINQLDGRTTEPYDPDAVIPNPARRRLDRNVRIARVTAGLARNELAALA